VYRGGGTRVRDERDASYPNQSQVGQAAVGSVQGDMGGVDGHREIRIVVTQ